ncbi:methionine/alanine import family NSS transporter small subunit [Streptomyces sp. NPDC012461]|jgi:flagellar basal body-associated protein FliL|uniref:Methionine/alanine import family NSS transporter small subunit n=2 Tax=unclassified Streptomyces TaxID=2593676 RepID=A0A6G3QNY3_9ACTN|nr:MULTISPECIES: methionine/alanine import family NSS transporter small subunit [unclassified Streptomyces]MBM7086985.1 methionine/alanine import family NSS transporter small subunit [Streptomyces sp. S12]NEA85199.1 methionine/alanine import family NSS transporter small subunit [Streptomyces sp. SID14436]NEC31262.1 methionine/alanine import family NSS transporter small subunit [Streptomyces sp. SID8111]NEC80751.1 methionine/alanine import family NSS transporter small subunit [Streptomyces sp. S
MSTSAIIMLIVAIVIVWGGLVGAIVHLRRHPERPEDDGPAPEPTA